MTSRLATVQSTKFSADDKSLYRECLVPRCSADPFECTASATGNPSQPEGECARLARLLRQSYVEAAAFFSLLQLLALATAVVGDHD